ncbi:hypothetical protein D3C72_449730 [compost metagenome]
MYEGGDRSTVINTGLITALCITKCEPGALCCFQLAKLYLIKRGNQLLVGGVELGIGPLVILKRTDVHVGLRHRRSTILLGLNGSGCQQEQQGGIGSQEAVPLWWREGQYTA